MFSDSHLIRFGGRLPVLRRDDGQTHLSLLVDVRVVNPRLERNLRRLERVLGLKDDKLSQILVQIISCLTLSV